MRHLKVAGKPEVDDDDGDVGFFSAKTQGIELAFRNEAVLDGRCQAGKTFPEGAMILTNVEFYGCFGSAFDPYTGALPDALVFGMDRRSVEASPGAADKSFMDGEVLTWIHGDGLRCLVAKFEDDKLVQFAVQFVLDSELR